VLRLFVTQLEHQLTLSTPSLGELRPKTLTLPYQAPGLYPLKLDEELVEPA
jgi:hypothetical protein